MKAKLLALACGIAIGASAQNVNSPLEENSDKLNAKYQGQLDNIIKHKQTHNLQLKKTNGMVSQRMSHADVGYLLFTNSLQALYSPFAPDSSYIQDFGTPSAVPAHAFGTTFDPASEAFGVIGQDYFAQTDPYTIDTIYIGSRYFMSSPGSGLTGDTIKVTVIMGDTLNDDVWRVGIGYPAGTFTGQNRRINIIPPRYTGNPNIGTPGTLDAPSQLVLKYALKAADTANIYKKIVPSVPINVPAGLKVGVFVEFIPGQSYDPSTQVYYRSSGKGDVNSLAYLRYTASNSGDNTPYFLEPLNIGSPSAGISFTLFSNTRYGIWSGSDAFRNEYVGPGATRGYLIDFWVSGSSTIGLDENTMTSKLKVYPNPSTGVVTFKMNEKGNLKLTVLNILGKTVHEELLNTDVNEQVRRDFSHLPKGIYMISMDNGKSRSTVKLTLE